MLRPQRPCADQRTGDLADPTPNRISRQSEPERAARPKGGHTLARICGQGGRSQNVPLFARRWTRPEPKPRGLSAVVDAQDGDMVRVPAGEFLMGSDRNIRKNPRTASRSRVFWMDRFAVTNERFERLVQQTGHVTVAHRQPDLAHYPGARPELLVPRSTVFRPAPAPGGSRQPVQLVELATWRQLAASPGTNKHHPRARQPPRRIGGLGRRPGLCQLGGQATPHRGRMGVCCTRRARPCGVHIGQRIHTRRPLHGQYLAGRIPDHLSKSTASNGLRPSVPSPPNDYGLYDMAGNVWEWTTDWFQQRHQLEHACCTISNPRGGDRELGYDLQELS
jgi:sulfatase modifying factor 1